jgi:hypothetical protein
MRYKQCNGDHTVFYRHSRCQILVLAVYVDDIIITGDDEREIIQLKENLRNLRPRTLGNSGTSLVLRLHEIQKGIVLS